MCHTDTSSANTDITAATRVNLTRFLHPSWRTRHCGEPSAADTQTVADGCGRLRTVADGCGRKRNFWRTQPHPQTPKWNGNPRYAFGNKNMCLWQLCLFTSFYDSLLLQLRHGGRHLRRRLVAAEIVAWKKAKKEKTRKRIFSEMENSFECSTAANRTGLYFLYFTYTHIMRKDRWLNEYFYVYIYLYL